MEIKYKKTAAVKLPFHFAGYRYSFFFLRFFFVTNSTTQGKKPEYLFSLIHSCFCFISNVIYLNAVFGYGWPVRMHATLGPIVCIIYFQKVYCPDITRRLCFDLHIVVDDTEMARVQK